MPHPNEDRSALIPLGPQCRQRGSTFLLTPLLIVGLSALTATGIRHGSPEKPIRQTKQVSNIGDDDARVLETGKPIRSELAGGHEHAYRIRLSADQFLQVIVEQQGIDVVVQVASPDGKTTMKFDSESRPEGQEEVSLVAEAAGEYRLIIKPQLKSAPVGSYEIRIEDLRPATDTDRSLYNARKMFERAVKLRDAGKFEEALRLALSAWEIREKLLGAEHADVAAAIDLVGGIYADRGEYDKAEPLYRRALAIREKAPGKEIETARSLIDLADLCYYQGKFKDAESLYQRSLEIREKSLGMDHPETAQSLDDLASCYSEQGKYEEAEPLYKRALDIREKALGEDHEDTASSLNNLALLYGYQGRYLEAEPLFKRALTIYEKVRGKEHPTTSLILNNLGMLYTEQAKYSEAEPFFKRALEISEKTRGGDHPDMALKLSNLALLYYYQGNYQDAEPLYKRALDISEKMQGKDHPETATRLNNLALLYEAQGKDEEVEPLLKRALAINEKARGKEHPKTANTLTNLADFYRDHQRYKEAEPLYIRALDIREKKLGNEHSDTAFSLDNLAGLYDMQGMYEEAEPLFKRALEIWEKALGKENRHTIRCYGTLATLYLSKGDIAQAVKFQSLYNAGSEHNLAAELVIGSERQKLAYLATFPKQNDQTISLHLRYAPENPVARDLAATLILQRKGRALDATSQNLNALRSRFNPEDQALLDRLTETRSQIATLVLRGPQNMTAEQHQARIKELEDQAEKDEADIGRRSSEFRAQFLPVTLEAVREAIPPDSVLLEFAYYRPFNAKAIDKAQAYGPPHYVAYILHHDGAIKWKELGDAKAIEGAITSLRKALRDPRRRDVKRLAHAVDAQVFQPLRPLLGAKKRLLISPDGALNLIPFPALVDEGGHYLVERYSISYLTSGRDLLRLQVSRESKSDPLVVAAPDFGRRSQNELAYTEKRDKEQMRDRASARSALGDFYFPPLPYATQEGKALRALLPGATLLTGDQATKAALSQVRSPELLHIATHGFFLEDQDLTGGDERGARSLSDDPERALRQLEGHGIRIENPLLRSGLALAGVNEHKENDNGLLTALEMTGLNLWGTKLVVLSACDTGVGEVKNGDGVYGLRRALVLAGAETQVISLWAVSDKATRDLMVSYYRKLQEGQGRGEALRKAQLEMLRDANRRHPYYWASFIQSGEWANLNGKRTE